VTIYSDRDDVRRDDRADLREAYERGRSDAQKARKRHPFLMTLTILAAVVGVIVLVLAALNGSFSGAGQVVDRNLGAAAVQAGPAMSRAADEAGQAVRHATNENNRTEAPVTR
jgi:crotonobetainyl-CoA:carnitine CoA-transferase CaiB-like acyl-CoA transferase